MPVFEIEANGAKYQIDAPDENAAFSAFQGMSAKPPLGVADTAKDVGNSLVAGVGKGIAGLAGMRGDIMGAGMDLGALAQRTISGESAAAQQKRLGSSPTYQAIRRGVTGADTAEVQRGMESAGGEFHKPQTRYGRYAETVGEFLPGTIGAGPAGAATRGAIGTIKHGIGTATRYGAIPGALSEGAGHATEGTGYEKAARVAAALGAPMALAKKGAGAAAPTREELFAQSDVGYDRLRNSGAEYKSQAVVDMARKLATELEDAGRTSSRLAPTTHKVLEALQDAPAGAKAVTIQKLEAARQELGGIAADAANFGHNEGRAARMGVERITDFISSADPRNVSQGIGQSRLQAQTAAETAARAAPEARGNYAAGSRSTTLGARDYNAGLQADAAHSGTNTDNALRQKAAGLLRQNDSGISQVDRSGFSKAETAALEGFVEGSAARNIARKTSNLMGGGGGMAAAVPGVVGAAATAATGNPLALLLAGVPVVGGAIKAGQNVAARRALDKIDEALRKRSPLYAERARNMPAETRRDAIIRALMPGAASLPNQ
jgi:hypothetical protein